MDFNQNLNRFLKQTNNQTKKPKQNYVNLELMYSAGGKSRIKKARDGVRHVAVISNQINSNGFFFEFSVMSACSELKCNDV